MKANSYYRHRILLINELRKALPVTRGPVNSPRDLLTYGYVSPELGMDDDLNDHATQASNAPLTFVELMSYNTWFEMNPDRVCGVEKPTTSVHFPITVAGSKEDVIKAIDATLAGKSDTTREKELLKLKIRLKAQALKLKLKLNAQA